MTGYLQRLLDTAPPASGPPPLTPVVKSTSPVFEQNQMLGLAELHIGQGATDAALPSAADLHGSRTASAQRPIPPAAPAVGRLPEMMPHDPAPLPLASQPDAMPGRPMSADPSPPGTAAVTATTPEPHEVPDTVIEPARPDPETLEPALRLDTAPPGPPEPATEAAPAPPIEPVLVPVETTQMATEATSLIGTEATSRPDTEPRPAAPGSVIRDAPGDARPIERAAAAPPLPRDLEPRPRPEFDDRDPEPHQPRSELPHAPPSITIGRVTVELVPDPAPTAKPARAPRTAAAASTIGPLGNRRARRRLFALRRL